MPHHIYTLFIVNSWKLYKLLLLMATVQGMFRKIYNLNYVLPEPSWKNVMCIVVARPIIPALA